MIRAIQYVRVRRDSFLFVFARRFLLDDYVILAVALFATVPFSNQVQSHPAPFAHF